MTIFYTILVVIHIFSAIVGLGPGFMLIQVVKSAHTVSQLRHAYAIRKRLHVFVMVGGTLLIVTGLLMGWVHPHLFLRGWYVLSLILFFIALAMGPLVMAPRARSLKTMLASVNDRVEEIPHGYRKLEKDLFFYERLENLLFLIIIALMILKPF